MIAGFLDYLSHERAYSPHTVMSYENDLKSFKAYLELLEAEVQLQNVDADMVRGWAMSLMASGMKATTINRKLSSLRTFYKYLLKRGTIKMSPIQNVHGPKRSKPLPQFVRESDMERLLTATTQGETWEQVREHTILQLFYETGIRRSELIELNNKDVDFERMTIKVTGKRNKQRIVPIGQGLADSLRRYLELKEQSIHDNNPSAFDSPFFVTDKGERIYPQWAYRLVHKNLSQVVTLKKRSPHVLRHTFATAMLNNEAELGAVKELMGHESVSTTQIYTHTTFEELKKAYIKAHPRASINHNKRRQV